MTDNDQTVPGLGLVVEIHPIEQPVEIVGPAVLWPRDGGVAWVPAGRTVVVPPGPFAYFCYVPEDQKHIAKGHAQLINVTETGSTRYHS